MGDTECRLERVVDALKDCYGKARLQVTGHMEDYIRATKSNNPKYLKTWNSVANHVLVLDFNPRAYVEWVFYNEYPSYPMPYKFALADRLNKYVSLGKPDPQYKQTKLKIELMMRRLSRTTKEDVDVIKFILDPLNEFDPIFTYTVAKNLGRQNELPPGILPEARKQAFYHPVYADKFDDIVPSEVITPWI